MGCFGKLEYSSFFFLLFNFAFRERKWQGNVQKGQKGAAYIISEQHIVV